MQHTLPSNNIDLLKSLIGHKIVKVSRQLFKSDMKQENYEQLADGSVEFVLDNGRIISFLPWVEIESVRIADVKMPEWGDSYVYKELTNNSFWQHRVNHKIEKITIFQSIYASGENALEFAIEFEFENKSRVCIEYLNEGDFPDTLRVLEKNVETRCTETVIGG